ncbi:STAS domain-containing protein [Candidatus Colwellia aromaticivorans]|uniref:STAS domain-containing protein n=1 Tax=Candidatus Colwellia aromaticivorans TaxID=2267621 RepID=UPI000DF4C0E1|nr:STAS domain-containing protein [Candidatus Colwellia aromaticivorans]
MTIISLNITTTPVELSGELTRHSIMQITKESIKALFLPSSTTLDLAQITRIDTAGLAWLFYLLEQANIEGCQLSFVNIPTKLDKLIRLSGVEGFLPVQ